MKRIIVTVGTAALLFHFLAACGDNGGGVQDVQPDEAIVPDMADQVLETPADAVPEVQDGTDVAADTPVEPAGPCEESDGYCVIVPITPDACVVCEDREGTHYKPAPPPDGTMGCPSGGSFDGWCCLPVVAPGTTQCETGDGECYPYRGGVEDTCPTGWILSRAMCRGSESCCIPGEGC
jgi:hypothetical protein